MDEPEETGDKHDMPLWEPVLQALHEAATAAAAHRDDLAAHLQDLLAGADPHPSPLCGGCNQALDAGGWVLVKRQDLKGLREALAAPEEASGGLLVDLRQLVEVAKGLGGEGGASAQEWALYARKKAEILERVGGLAANALAVLREAEALTDLEKLVGLGSAERQRLIEREEQLLLAIADELET